MTLRRCVPLLSALITVVAHLAPERAAAAAQPGRRPRPAPQPAPAAPASPTPAAPAADSVGPAQVAVSVVEMAAGVAYLKPGAAAGVRRGARVTLAKREFVVVAATASYAEIDPGDAPIREGTTGTARAITESEDRPKELPTPRPLEQMRGEWGAWQRPADTQHPRPVPLGTPDRDRRYDVLFYASAGGMRALGDSGGSFAQAEIGARAHFEPFRAPVALDVDGSLARWFGGGIYDRAGVRPTLRVRELQLGIGDPMGYFAGLGRIRYAASTLGALDGLRAHAPLGSDFSVSAFGGMPPDPLDGEPSTRAQRFGAELAWAKRDVALRPEAAVVVHGSTFGGKIDERRLAAMFGIYPGASRAGAHVEVSAFDKDNPWGVSPVELTAAGLDGTLRAGMFQLGARLDVRQQERSMWLASYLPTSWFCVREPAPPPAPGQQAPAETCGKAQPNTQHVGSLDASIATDHLGVMIAGTAAYDPLSPSSPMQLGSFANVRVLRIFRLLRLEMSGTVSTGTYMDMFSGAIGPGVSAFADRLDVSAYYRRSALHYRVGDPLSQNAVGGYATLLPSHDVVASLQWEGATGNDVRSLMAMFSVIWRPRF